MLSAILLVVGLGWAAMAISRSAPSLPADPTLWALATSLRYTATTTQEPPVASPTFTPTAAPTLPAQFGSLVFAARLGGKSHVYAYAPGLSAPVPVAAGEWNDRDPAFSPDGLWLAFASDRSGHWDLYLIELRTQELVRLTDTPGFEAHPTWSPDSRWLAFEAYADGDFDIWILPVDGGQPPIQLTNQPGADIEPSWDPNGRRIAFASDREGGRDIFLADLDNPGERFINLTRSPDSLEAHPAFSPDGTHLAFSTREQGLERLVIVDLSDGGQAAREVGQGDMPAWSPDGLSIAAVQAGAEGTRLVTYASSGMPLLALGFPLQGPVHGLDWTAAGLPGEVVTAGQEFPTPAPLLTASTAGAASGQDRLLLVQLPDLPGPHTRLSDAVDDAFNALRERTGREAGWDFLGSLEHAFVGLNDPLPPGFAYNDWLYTGRAFAFNPAVLGAGWAEVLREDVGGLTYWRIFVRTSPQDGSLGEPLRGQPWDFESRFIGDASIYDQGGALKDSIPSGYYIDFTAVAAEYGFARLPAMSNWRTYYPAARYNEFVRTDGLDWVSAMLDLYPPSAIVTPTPFRTPTLTPTLTPRPTPTPWWWRWLTPSPTRTATPPATPTYGQ